MKATDKAFPIKTEFSTEFGLEVRDYIAIQAMTGLLANPECTSASEERIVKLSYRMADAMIKQSEVKDE